MKIKTVGWFSGGVSSFVSIYLERESIDDVIFIDIDDHHKDTYRFLKDCEKVLGKEIKIIRHNDFKSVKEVIKKTKYINGPMGARCTLELKKRVRLKWEKEQDVDLFNYVWGYDANEIKRAERLLENNPEYNHKFPLIEKGLSKEQVHGILYELDIKRPMMYDLGYSNNNCVGCVKGGMGYWNKIRQDFPDKFEEMAKLEREIGRSCLKGVFLDELEPAKGRVSKAVLPDCGMLCELSILEK